MKTILELKQDLASGAITSEAIVQECLDRIKAQDGDVHAFLAVSETALEEARESDRRRAAGESLGLLEGIPVALKDNILVQDWENTASSKILKGHKSAYSSTVAERLRSAGAILIGRTNMDEFAMGSSTENSAFGATKNPWDLSRVPGGSSGGSIAAVAAGMVPAALGSDTGGSVRQPASLCGVTGLKPTYGRVSRYGLMAMASSLDQIGPATRTVADAALILEAIEGKDDKDATSVELEDTTVAELLNPSVEGMTIGIPKEYFVEGMDEEIRAKVMDAIKVFEENGATIKEISLPHAEYALAAYYIIMPAESSSNLGRFDGVRYGAKQMGESLIDSYEKTRGAGFGAEVKRRIMLGSYTLSAGYYDAYYRKALKTRTLIKQDFEEAFKDVDVILSPTSPSVAWPIGEKFSDPLTMYLSDIYTISANLATIPAMSIPCGFAQDLPVGLQLMARPFNEQALFQAGAFYQSKTDWHTKTPA